MARKNVQNNTGLLNKAVKTYDELRKEYKNNPTILNNIKKLEIEKARESKYFRRPTSSPTVTFELGSDKPLTPSQRNKLLLTCMGKIIECIAETL